MAESELARKITKLVKTTDKLVRDIQKATEKLIEAARELKEKGEKEE